MKFGDVVSYKDSLGIVTFTYEESNTVLLLYPGEHTTVQASDNELRYLGKEKQPVDKQKLLNKYLNKIK